MDDMIKNTGFTEIKDIKRYIREKTESREMKPGVYKKTGDITARQGVVGEEIVTVMSNGLKETVNTVKADENGNPGWVVTNPTGEKYIVADKTFRGKYELIDGTENGFRPVFRPIIAGRTNENISFPAPWGTPINLLSGGYLVFTDMDDIYGIQADEFYATYKEI